MSIAANRFRLSIEAVWAVQKSEYQGVDELVAETTRRGGYILTLAALETYFTTLCVSSVFDRYAEMAPSEFASYGWPQYKEFYNELGRVIPKKRDAPSNTIKLRESIISDSHAVSFTTTKRIFSVVKFVAGAELDQDSFWAGVATRVGRGSAFILGGRLWDLIVERRNMMVHEGDFISNSLERKPLSSGDLQIVLEVATAIVENVESLRN